MAEKRVEDLSLENKSVMEIVELVSSMEEKFGVSAAAAIAASSSQVAEGSTETFDLWLTSFGSRKVSAIKAVRLATGLGLKESKRLVDSAPVLLKEGVSKSDAEDMIRYFRSHGIQLTTTQMTDDFLAPRKVNIEESSLDETQLDLLACQTMGLNPDEFPVSRIIPVNIYMASGESSDEVIRALFEFLNAFDFDEAGESPAVISSFFKRLWFRTTSKETLDELKTKLKKMEEALEAQQIDKPKSEIDLNHATAAEKLLNALGNDSKSTALHVGNLLVLVLIDESGDKHNRVITLTKEQIEMIQRDQSLLRKPELLLQHLNPEQKKIGL